MRLSASFQQGTGLKSVKAAYGKHVLGLTPALARELRGLPIYVLDEPVCLCAIIPKAIRMEYVVPRTILGESRYLLSKDGWLIDAQGDQYHAFLSGEDGLIGTHRGKRPIFAFVR